MTRICRLTVGVPRRVARRPSPEPSAPRTSCSGPPAAPGSEGKTAPEKVENARVSSIHKPSLTVYLPPKEKATGAGVIVIPGGGHRFLAIDHEGYAVAAGSASAVSPASCSADNRRHSADRPRR